MIDPNHMLVLCDFETTGVEPDTDYPIEVAILCCDSELRPVAAYESLIFLAEWRDYFWDAVPIHGITLPVLARDGVKPDDVAKGIVATVDRGKKILRANRAVLVSDNAQFEHRFMRKLLARGEQDWPFHYCTWDSSLLLEATGVGDPKPRHRAMADVGLLHAALVEALRVVRSPNPTR